MRILVVEDDPTTRAAVVGALSPRFTVVKSVESGEACLDCCSDYDLIILDWNLPKMSGVDCARKIKEKFPGSRPVLIVLTARHTRDEDAEVYASGVTHFMNKLDPDVYYKLVWNARLVEKRLDEPVQPRPGRR